MCERSRSPVRHGCVRPLVERDRAAIESINAVTYGGHDYIAAAFSGWLKREGIDLWSAGLEDEQGVLVGLEMLTLLDKGKTGYVDALRVHPRARGCGVALKIQKHLIGIAKDQLKLPRVRYTTSTANTASRKLAARCGFCTVAKWGMITPGGDAAGGDTGSVGENGKDALVKYAQSVQVQLDQLGGHAALKFNSSSVSAQELVAYACQHNTAFLLQMFKAYDFTVENVQKLLGDDKCSKPITATRVGDGHIDSFSWTVLNSDAHGITAFITIYADTLVSVLAHLVEQLHAVINVGACYVMIKYNLDLEPELLRLNLTERMFSELAAEGPLPVPRAVFLYELIFSDNQS